MVSIDDGSLFSINDEKPSNIDSVKVINADEIVIFIVMSIL